jgi:hypothetical protein
MQLHYKLILLLKQIDYYFAASKSGHCIYIYICQPAVNKPQDKLRINRKTTTGNIKPPSLNRNQSPIMMEVSN